jgi:predicted secreted protein
MSAFSGRDVLVEFSIADETATAATLTFSTLGMMRGKSMKTNWDTVDTTADKSPAYTKTSLVTFKSVEFSGDGVSYTEALHNQLQVKQLVISPSAATSFQPKAWMRLTDPDGSFYVGPFIITEWSDERPYADTATWSIKATSNGEVTFTAGITGPDLRPRWGLGDATAGVATAAALFAAMTNLFGVTGTKTGTASITSTASNYVWVAVLASASTTGVTFTGSLGVGGFAGASSAGDNTGASPTPTESVVTYTDPSGNTWRFFRADYVNSDPTAANYTLS